MIPAFKKIVVSPVKDGFRRAATKWNGFHIIPRKHVQQDCFESSLSLNQDNSSSVSSPASLHLYIFNDPQTGKRTHTTKKPAELSRSQKEAIFQDGCYQLKKATTLEEKCRALNKIMIGVPPNRDGECIGITRTILEILRTGNPVSSQDFAHLNRTLNPDPLCGGMASLRTDKTVNLPGRYFHGKPEADLYSYIDCVRYSSWDVRNDLKIERDALHQSFLDEYSIKPNGFKKFKTVDELKQTLIKAGNGSLAYIYPGSHVFGVVNLDGDLIALHNYHGAPACAEKLTASHCHVNGDEDLACGITTHKIKL